MSSMPTSTFIRPVETEDDLHRCFPVLRELRPHLEEETFLPTMRRMQRDGYFLVMAESDGQIVAVAACRYGEHLERGRYLYIDDFVTAAAARRQGHGAKLFAWLVEMARATECVQLHLDSNLQRPEAHLFYEALGMTFSSRNYSLQL